MLLPFGIEQLHAFTEHMPSGHWAEVHAIDQVTIWRWEPSAPGSRPERNSRG